MKSFFKNILLVLALVTVTNFASAQNISIREAAGSEVTNVWSALKYIAENTVTPDANGVVHIDLTGEVTEPGSFTEGSATFRFPASIKKIVISSTSETRHLVRFQVGTGSDDTKNAIYMLRFENKACELEVKNVTFGGKDTFGWVASSTSTDFDVTSMTYIHDCTFNAGYQLGGRNAMTPETLSETFLLENNTFNYGSFYAFHVCANTYRTNENFIFKKNELYNFRGVSLFPKIDIPLNVTFEDNIFYHQQNFADFGGTCVTLCQATGTINGKWTMTGNKVLGLFTAKNTIASKQKTCALITNHRGEYSSRGIGIADGSVITLENNLLQCDVYQIAFKQGTGESFDPRDITEEVLEHTYFDNVPGQTGNYTAIISGNNFVHMYPKENATHRDDDACHVCTACGQMVIRAEVAGHGGTFQYEADGQMHDVNEAETTIARNLYTTDIAPGVDLNDKIVTNIKRDGFCLEPKATQDFVITPNTPNAFSTLTLYGRETPKDVTTSATTTDEGKTYHYTLTNDFTQLDPYTMCPKLVATINYGSIIIECEGLEGKESAVFEIKDNSGTVLNTVTLNAAHPKKVVAGFTAGTYKVAPQNIAGKNWQWTYVMNPSDEQTVTVVLNQDATAKFTVAKKTGTTVKNGEDYKENQLKTDAISGPSTVSNWKKGGSVDL